MSLELITAHTGTAHITAEQVASLIKGAISDDSDNLYRFQTGNQCAYSITDALQVQIDTGDAVLSGRHFQITEAETFDIDPSTLNYSRIDGIFFEIYSDNDTSEELCRFEVVQGSEYLTSGGTASLPTTPTTIDDTHTLMYVFPWLYVYVSYETITEVVDGTTDFPNMLSFESSVNDINTTIETMQETFQDGVDSIYNAIVAEGVTPSSSTPTDCATGIATVADEQYAAGVSDIESTTWTESMTVYGSTNLSYSSTIVYSGVYLSTKNIVSIVPTSIPSNISVDIHTYNSSGVGYNDYLGVTTSDEITFSSSEVKVYIEVTVSPSDTTGLAAGQAVFNVKRQLKELW